MVQHEAQNNHEPMETLALTPLYSGESFFNANGDVIAGTYGDAGGYMPFFAFADSDEEDDDMEEEEFDDMEEEEFDDDEEEDFDDDEDDDDDDEDDFDDEDEDYEYDEDDDFEYDEE
ncbi:MAG: hypothetical protein LBH20_09715 [Treponema sp.]|jgi:hypothetical protein|nr:hypothetical protein [Treponema sp.]